MPPQSRWFAIAIIALTSATATSSAQSRESADARTWQAAVVQHAPGALPPATVDVAHWPWERLSPVLDYVKKAATPDVLVRAAVMYLDIAVGIPERERPVYPTGAHALQAQDGRPLYDVPLDSQFWYARWLAARALQRSSIQPDLRELALSWFRAGAAAYARNLQLADLEPHVREALRLFPDDPGVLFDAGCHAETLAAPAIDVARQSQIASARGPRPLMRPMSAAEHLGVAERHYRASLAIDPSNVEARVRLGRVLARRQRVEEAVQELERATASAEDRTVSYYAWLYLGRGRADLRRYDEALEAFGQAARRVPTAPSPHIGISRVHSARGDLNAARAALLRAFDQIADDHLERDPYWQYDHCAGRDAERIYQAFIRDVRERMQNGSDAPASRAWLRQREDVPR